MSRFLSKLKARLEPGQQFASEETGWVRAALESMEQEVNQPELAEKMKELSLVQCSTASGSNTDEAELVSRRLWETGSLECRLPNGFLSIIPNEESKVRPSALPSVDNIYGADAGVWDILLVDDTRDKTLAKLKELCLELVHVKGFEANSADTIRKLAGMVADFYGGPLFETGNITDVTSSSQDRKGNLRLLADVKVGLCRPRALLFKYLADFVGLESRIIMGLQDSFSSTSLICSNPKKHLTNVVGQKGKYMLVDVMRHPGHLRPFTVKALVRYHTAGPGDSDSAEYDSCDSPLEPNSPLFFGQAEKVDAISPSQSELDLPNPSWRHARRKSMSEECKLSPEAQRFYPRRHMVDGARSFPSSPEHPQSRLRSFRCIKSQAGSNPSSPDSSGARARAPSILSGSRRTQDEEASTSSPDDSPHYQNTTTGASFRRRSSSFCVREGSVERACNASSVEPRKSRRRNNAPEIGDEVVRAVRAMKEAMRQHCKNAEQDSGGVLERSGTGSEPSSINLCSNSEGLAADPSRIPRNFSKDDAYESSSSTDFILPTQPLMPFPEWAIDFSELRIGIRVGIGSFGEVFRGTWRGTEVAVKVMLEQDLTRENTEDFFNEIALLSRLRHPNVILFMGACTKPPHLSMVTEYMHMGSLYRLIHNSNQGKKLSWRRRLKMLRDICRGLMCVQRMNIVHRDLKSANCLVDKHWCVKICDFGLSRYTNCAPVREATAAGTPEWMAPELLRNEPVTEKCDVFSLGVIMWELCTLKRPWEGVQPLQVVYEVSHNRGRLEIPEGPLGKLVSDCWQENPADRPSFDEILSRLHECDFLLGE